MTMAMVGIVVLFIHLVFVSNRISSYTPVVNNYDFYGRKIFMNNQLLVYADNLYHMYKVFLAPFSTPTYCTPSITDLGNNNIQCAFVYAVMTPRNSSSLPYFVYNCIDILYNNVVGRYTFINNGSSCAYQHTNAIVPGNYSTQVNFVIGVDYKGSGIYAFADDFTAYYDFQSLQITSWPNTLPISPRMVDFTSGYGVLVGYCQSTVSQAFECGFIVLVNGSSSSPQNGSVFSIGNSLKFAWSDPRSTHFIASSKVYSTVDLISVSVAPSGRVLIGIRALNTVLLYIVTNPMNFSTINPLSTRQTGENLMGFGRSVEWLDTDGDKAVIIANQYTYSTNQWISSAFHVYDIESDGFSDQTNPILIYPNSQQMIGPLMNPSFIRLVSDQLSGNIAILDLSGDAVIILSAAPGTYATTDQPSIFSIAVPCIPGTYRDYAGIELCTPCPNGTTSTSSKINCTACTSSDVFCPYGAVAKVPYTAFDPIVQEQNYPESPESTVFDDILMQNMFSLSTQSLHCLVVSPITWVLVVFGFGSIILISMGISTIVCPGTHPVRDQAKRVFKKMDLIGEGELWIGGLVSAAVVVLIISAYTFSNSYLYQYPIEAVGESSFACDTTIRNAEFSSSLQMSKPQELEDIQPIFDLLEAQPFTLNIDFINSAFNCSDTLLVQRVISYTLITLPITSCSTSYNDSILSLSVLLPSHDLSLQVMLPGMRTVGAVRLGLSGPAVTAGNGRYVLLALNVSSTFTPSSLDLVLAPSVTFSVQMSQIVNQTNPLDSDGLTIYSAIWFATYTVQIDQLFVSEDRYSFFKRTQTNLCATISESIYYVRNEQKPIARQTEVIFHNLLFTIVVLELFGLLFVICKLFLVPLVRFLHERVHRYLQKKKQVNVINDNNDNMPAAIEMNDNCSLASTNRATEVETKDNLSPPSTTVPITDQ